MRRTNYTQSGLMSPNAATYQSLPPHEEAWQLSHRSRTLKTPTGTVVPMSSAEFDLLVFMATRRGRHVSRDEISQAVFQRPHSGAMDRTVDNLLSRLRRSLMPYLDSGNAFRALRGRGYVFVGFNVIQTDSPPRTARQTSELTVRRKGA